MKQTMKHYFFGSLTRNSDLETKPFDVRPLSREQWSTGDYVVGKHIVVDGCQSDVIQSDGVQIATGRFARIMRGDLVVGALGVRGATLETTGDWHAIGPDGRMEDLTHSGLFGRETSKSCCLKPHPAFIYIGHVVRDGKKKICMQDFMPTLPENKPTYTCPTIMIIGTSMSCGKTTTARVIIRLLKDMGIPRVVAIKLTGAGCYSDIFLMKDAGADAVFDFVDAGLPSSIVSPEEYREALQKLISQVSAQNPDVVVAEVGASPLEPYNGSIAIEEMGNRAQFVVLCASDPFAVVGAVEDFGIKPDIVSGIAVSTSAGVELVRKMTGFSGLSLTDESVHELRKLLESVVKPKLS
jgi:hypothetical protein